MINQQTVYAVATLVATVIQYVIVSKQPVRKETELQKRLDKIDELIDRIEVSERPIELKLATTEPELAAAEPAKEDDQPFKIERGGQIKPVTESVSTACIPCARAHLVGAAAELDEATRFLLEPPTDETRKEIMSRISGAAREIVALERYDWSPEKLMASRSDVRQIVYKYQPRLRRLRQRLLNQVRTPDDLREVAAEANRLWSDFHDETFGIDERYDAASKEQYWGAAKKVAKMRSTGATTQPEATETKKEAA